MNDPLTGPTMELRVLPRARPSEAPPVSAEPDDAVDIDPAAMALTTHEGEVLHVDAEPVREMVQQELRITMTRFQGPIPMPEILAAYDALLPGSADRLIAMAEAEQRHRFAMERVEVEAPFIAARWGQVLGFSIAGVVVVCSLIMVLNGHEVTGGILGGLDLIALATLFVTSGAAARSSSSNSAAGAQPAPAEEPAP